MICYMDRTWCNQRDCVAECDRRFYGTRHEERVMKSVVPWNVSEAAFRGTPECVGYVGKEVTPCSASDANTAPVA